MKELVAVLRNRNVALLLTGRMVSYIGDNLYWIALSVAIYEYSGRNSFYVGLFWVLRLVPSLVLGPFAGALADRMGYRRAMLAADLGRMALVIVLAVLLHQSTWPVIFPLALGINCLSSLFRPASVGLIPSLVNSSGERLAANAAMIEISSIAVIAGSALGGIGAGAGLITQLLLFDAASFGVSAVSLFYIRPHQTERESSAPEVSEHAAGQTDSGFVEGYRMLLQRPLLVFAASVMLLPELASGALVVWIVPYAESSLHLGSAGVGYLYAVFGVGMALGGLAAALVGSSFRLDQLLAGSVLLGGVALALFGVWPVAIPAMIGFTVMGMAETIEYAAYETLLQQAVPENMIGRASGTIESLFFNVMLVGNVASGLLAGWLGLTLCMAGLGTLIIAATALSWLSLRRSTADQPDAAILAKVPALALLPLDVREWAVRRMVREQFASGDEVVKQGETGDKFYAIASGKVRVDVAVGPKTISREYGPGDYFGEIALLQKVPRTATVTALQPLTTFVLSREDFDELQSRAADFKKSIMDTAAARLSDDTNYKMALVTRD